MSDQVKNPEDRFSHNEAHILYDLLQIADCGGMPLEEQPGKVCEAFRLFLQGQGYSKCTDFTVLMLCFGWMLWANNADLDQNASKKSSNLRSSLLQF